MNRFYDLGNDILNLLRDNGIEVNCTINEPEDFNPKDGGMCKVYYEFSLNNINDFDRAVSLIAVSMVSDDSSKYNLHLLLDGGTSKRQFGVISVIAKCYFLK